MPTPFGSAARARTSWPSVIGAACLLAAGPQRLDDHGEAHVVPRGRPVRAQHARGEHPQPRLRRTRERRDLVGGQRRGRRAAGTQGNLGGEAVGVRGERQQRSVGAREHGPHRRGRGTLGDRGRKPLRVLARVGDLDHAGGRARARARVAIGRDRDQWVVAGRPQRPQRCETAGVLRPCDQNPHVAAKLPRLPPKPGMADRVPRRDEVLRVRGPRNRQAGRHPGHRLRLRHQRRRGALDRRADRRPDRDQVPGAHRRPHEGRRRPVRRHARRGRRARRGDPGPRDRRPHAARRAGRPQGRGQAGVLRRRRLGRHPQAAADPVQRHGRDRHRAGGRGAPRPRGPRPLLQPPALLRLPGQAGDRRGRRDRRRAQPPDADRGAPGPAVPSSAT